MSSYPSLSRERLVYSPTEVAELLSVSRQTIYNLMDRGELPSYRIGRSRRIHIDAINALLAANQTGDHEQVSA